MRQNDFLLVCPKCGSTNVSNDLSKDMISWGGSTRYLCNDCDYSAIMFPEMKKTQISKFKSNISQRTPEEKRSIQKQEISKGFLDKTINKLFAYYNLILLFIFLVWAFWYFNQ
ncbi:MAG TPA: hypothetical protein VJI97_04665 [Candidatus Nanoarchaeia archaeon]|nr:hypothetical protein [Candidatus Nanoarchaeia archaeon]